MCVRLGFSSGTPCTLFTQLVTARRNCVSLFFALLFSEKFGNPTNIASVNLVISYNKDFFSHYSNTCAGVLTLYK